MSKYIGDENITLETPQAKFNQFDDSGVARGVSPQRESFQRMGGASGMGKLGASPVDINAARTFANGLVNQPNPKHPELTQGLNRMFPKPGYKDGGLIKGAGTGRSDSIPANLIEGDAIIPAARVKLLGEDFLNEIKALVPDNEMGEKGEVVPAQVSNGEFRFTADEVKFLGKKFIDDLIYGESNPQEEGQESASIERGESEQEPQEQGHYAKGGMVNRLGSKPHFANGIDNVLSQSNQPYALNNSLGDGMSGQGMMPMQFADKPVNTLQINGGAGNGAGSGSIAFADGRTLSDDSMRNISATMEHSYHAPSAPTGIVPDATPPSTPTGVTPSQVDQNVQPQQTFNPMQTSPMLWGANMPKTKPRLFKMGEKRDTSIDLSLGQNSLGGALALAKGGMVHRLGKPCFAHGVDDVLPSNLYQDKSGLPRIDPNPSPVQTRINQTTGVTSPAYTNENLPFNLSQNKGLVPTGKGNIPPVKEPLRTQGYTQPKPEYAYRPNFTQPEYNGGIQVGKGMETIPGESARVYTQPPKGTTGPRKPIELSSNPDAQAFQNRPAYESMNPNDTVMGNTKPIVNNVWNESSQLSSANKLGSGLGQGLKAIASDPTVIYGAADPINQQIVEGEFNRGKLGVLDIPRMILSGASRAPMAIAEHFSGANVKAPIQKFMNTPINIDGNNASQTPQLTELTQSPKQLHQPQQGQQAIIDANEQVQTPVPSVAQPPIVTPTAADLRKQSAALADERYAVNNARLGAQPQQIAQQQQPEYIENQERDPAVDQAISVLSQQASGHDLFGDKALRHSQESAARLLGLVNERTYQGNEYKLGQRKVYNDRNQNLLQAQNQDAANRLGYRHLDVESEGNQIRGQYEGQRNAIEQDYHNKQLENDRSKPITVNTYDSMGVINGQKVLQRDSSGNLVDADANQTPYTKEEFAHPLINSQAKAAYDYGKAHPNEQLSPAMAKLARTYHAYAGT